MTPPGTYICDDSHSEVCPCRPTTNPRGEGHCWHESTIARLIWQGGVSVNAAADLAAWNALGTRREVAA